MTYTSDEILDQLDILYRQLRYYQQNREVLSSGMPIPFPESTKPVFIRYKNRYWPDVNYQWKVADQHTGYRRPLTRPEHMALEFDVMTGHSASLPYVQKDSKEYKTLRLWDTWRALMPPHRKKMDELRNHCYVAIQKWELQYTRLYTGNVSKIRYNRFLQSDTWKRIRAQRIAIDNGQCVYCMSSKNIEVHHKTYIRSMGEELPEDLETVCRHCHAIIHGKVQS